MKSMNEKMAKWGRRVAVAAALLFSFGASADWLWWTLDFTDNWGNPGEPQPNPAGAGVGGFDIYLVVEDTTSGDWVTTVKGGSLVNDQMTDGEGSFVMSQVEVSDFSTSEYAFFVEMVNTDASVKDVRYWSPRYSYADLVAAGHISTELTPVEVPWNPAVGAPWSVPEPTSGMLICWGLALLALRRRRMKVMV